MAEHARFRGLYLLGVAMGRLLSKVVSICLTALQVWVPAAVLYLAYPRHAHADAFMDAARQGQTFGLGILPDATTLGGQDPAGNVHLNYQGKTATIAPQQLFPDTQNTTDPGSQSTYGNDAQVKNQANNAVQDMVNSQSNTGKAYQALISGANSFPHMDMSNLSMWNQTDETLTQVLTQAASSNCEPVTTGDPITTTTHIPDYRTCERIVFPGSTCKCRHDYSVELLGWYSVGAKGQSTGSISITVDLKTGQILTCSGGSYCQTTLYGASAPPADACNAPATGVNKAVSYFQPYAGVTMTQSPTCANNFVASFSIWHSSKNPEWLFTGTLVVGMYHVVDNGWTCDPGCAVLLSNPDGDNFIHPQSYACTAGPNDNCEFFSGSQFCQGDLPSTNPFASKGISNLCQEVTVTLDNSFNSGQMNCWTDPQGQVHCPTANGGQTDTCKPLEENPACLYISSSCIDGAQDPGSGVCYAFNVVFDCGQDVPITDPQTTMTYICNGVLKCMGEGCINGQFDPNNTDFPKAAAALQMAQYAQQDLDCNADLQNQSGQGCSLFNGRHMECKKALGGYIDCCEQPDGVSIIEYIRLITTLNYVMKAEWDLTGVFPEIFATNPLNGVWTTLKSPYDFMKNVISSAWDNLIGKSLPDLPFSSMTSTFSQTIMQGAYDFISAISPDLASSMFEVGGVTGIIEFSETMLTFINIASYVMWLYTLYQLFDILVHIIWACEQSELELGAKRQLKVCHFVGSYCNSRFLGICLEKRDSFCCFNSPMGRIFQEQIRQQPQVGRPWGRAQEPDCRGLTGPDLALVDWNQVNLDEWIALLNLAGKYPTQKTMTSNGLTGSGSPWNFDHNGRPDVIQRTQERLNYTGEDLEKLRNNKALQMWGVSP
ncbi:MAG: conjugal transfer protein TraN [Thermodesulfobacteriota bacterium]